MEYDMNKMSFPRKMPPLSPENIEALSFEEIRQVLHDLHVHQVELEMQNVELRTMQADLDAARARYFDLYDLAPVGYCTLSEKGMILEANLTAATLLGLNRSALLKRPLTRYILPDDQNIYFLHRKQLFETGEPQTCDLRMVKNDGTQFWAHLVATAAQDSDSALVCRVVISDITERKLAEQAYKDSEFKYRSFIEHSSDVVFCVDRNGEYKFVNQVFASTFGKTPDYFLGKTFWDIYPKDQADYRQAASSRVFETGESQSVEVVVPLPDRTLYFLAKANPVRDETGNVVLNLTHATDITDRKQAEAEKAELEVQNRQLQKAESLGRMAGAIAHHFNNQLYAVMGNLEMAMDDLPRGVDISETWPKLTRRLTKQRR
jgi:PAS domain S-box-containing protein